MHQANSVGGQYSDYDKPEPGRIVKSLLPSSIFRRDVDPSKYRLEIDGLRFFAIMIVMVGHLMERVNKFWIAPNTDLQYPGVTQLFHFLASPNQGVLLFFAISGFIISKQMQDVPAGRFDGAFVGKYYLRRMTRIFPPYYVLLLGTFVVYAFIGFQPQGLNSTYVRDVPLTESLLASLAYSHGLIYDSMPRLFPLGWSLEVEVQFYILAPFIFLALFRGDHRTAPWRFLVLTLTAFVISFVAVNKLVPITSYSIASHIVYFAIGISLARYEEQVRRLFRVIGNYASLVIGFGAVIILFWLGTAEFSSVAMTIFQWALSLGSIFVLFGLAFQPATMFGKFCRIPIITYIGLACYSLYLVHMQVFHMATLMIGKYLPMSYFMVGAGFVLVMLAGLIAGGVFFTLVEKPFATWRPFSSKKPRKAPA